VCGRGFCSYVFVCVFPLVFLVFRVFGGLFFVFFVFGVALLAMGMTAVLVAAAVMSAASHISKR
jgi:hypothetical protein